MSTFPRAKLIIAVLSAATAALATAPAQGAAAAPQPAVQASVGSPGGASIIACDDLARGAGPAVRDRSSLNRADGKPGHDAAPDEYQDRDGVPKGLTGARG
jgi:hypothetical protein